MKNLEEKKLLLKMMRAFGQDDPELAESIRREEELTEKFLGINKVVAKPLVELVEETKPKPVILKEAEPPPPPAPAFTPPTTNTVLDVVNVLKTANANANTSIYRDKELEGMRRSITEMMQKINTLSWGGGGTGVVRFFDLDDHQYPVDVKALTFNTAGPDYDPPDGSISWNPDEECMDIHQPDGTTLQVGLENYIRVRNATGNTMNNGTLVTFAGVNGNFDPLAAPLLANTTFDPLFTIGVLTEPIANGDVGRATTFGKVRDLDTTGTKQGQTWNIGDLLWACPANPGCMTNVKPTAPNVAISIAAVTRVDATEGEILVRPTIFPRLFYGNFAQTANQALTAADTAYPVLFDKTNFSSGHVLNANGVITSQVTGLFKYDVNYNITSSNSSRRFVYMWIRKNGIDQQNTALRFSIESNGGEVIPHGSFVLSMTPGDNVQMMVAATGTSISLFGLGASGIFPSAPSAVVTIAQINQ